MKKISAVITAVLAAFAITACTSTRPVCATSNPVGSKVGTATAALLFSWIPIPFSQDTGIQKAAKNGNIKLISTVDTKTFTFLGIYTSVTTIVTGE